MIQEVETTMIQTFIKRFYDNKDDIRAEIAKAHIRSYDELVRIVIENITDNDYVHNPDPSRIHCIDDGDYQGTLVFIIAAKGYQPNRYWATKVYYGSCSGCDALHGISNYSDQPPTEEQIKDYMSLALNVVQGLVEI